MSIFDTYMVRLAADLRSGKVKSIQVTLPMAAGTPTCLAIPAWARGMRVYPDKDLRLGIDENPAADAASSDTEIAEAAYATGGYALAGRWEVRLLEEYSGAERTLRLTGAAGDEVALVEFF